MTETIKKVETGVVNAVTPEERERQFQNEEYHWLDEHFGDRDYKDRLTYAMLATMWVN